MKNQNSSLSNLFVKSMLAMTISGLTVASASAQNSTLEASQNQSQDQQQQQSQNQDQQQQRPDFREMDADQDELLVWREIYVVMDPRIVAANLDQEQIFNQYDNDNDDALDEEEFNSFVEGLEQTEIAAASTQAVAIEAETDTSASTDTSATYEASGEVQHGANQSVLRSESRYSESNEAGQQTQQRQSQLSNESTQTESDVYTADQSTQVEQDQYTAEGTDRNEYSHSDTELSERDYERENGPQARDSISGRSVVTNESSMETRTESTTQQSQSQTLSQGQAQSIGQAPIESLQDKTVTNARGEKIGEVKNVVVNRDQGKVGLVVESGGVMGIGAKEILAPVDDVTLSQDNVVWNTEKTEKELKKTERFNKSEGYVEVSDQYETVDEIRQAGISDY